MRTLLQSRRRAHLTGRAGTKSLVWTSHIHTLHSRWWSESEARWAAHARWWTGEETWWRTHVAKWGTAGSVYWTTQTGWPTAHVRWGQLVWVWWHRTMTGWSLILLEEVGHVGKGLRVTHVGLKARWWWNAVAVTGLVSAVEERMISWQMREKSRWWSLLTWTLTLWTLWLAKHLLLYHGWVVEESRRWSRPLLLHLLLAWVVLALLVHVLRVEPWRWGNP